MRWLGLLAALFLLLLAVLWRLPATWLDRGVQGISRGAIALVATQGTVWRGSGVLQAVLPSGEVATLERVTWRFDASSLPQGVARLELRREADAKSVLEVRTGVGGWFLGSLDLRFPAGLLGVFSATLGKLGLTGEVHVALRRLGRRDGRLTGDGRLAWHAAGSSLARTRPLGDYRIDLAGKGDAFEYRLYTRDGPLELRGAGRWRPGTNPVFDGEAIPAPKCREELSPMLRMLGKDTGAGAYTLTFDANTGLSAR